MTNTKVDNTSYLKILQDELIYYKTKLETCKRSDKNYILVLIKQVEADIVREYNKINSKNEKNGEKQSKTKVKKITVAIRRYKTV